MKKTISMLFICAFAVTACGPEETTPAPTPAPAPAPTPTCQKPRGAYTLNGMVTQIAAGPNCPQSEPGASHAATANVLFDVAGNVVSIYKDIGMKCTTAYSNNNCTVKASCSVTEADGTFGEEHSYNLSEDGLVLRGYYALTGTGVYCPRVVIEGVAQYTTP